ncbi:MAG: hypothetical protein ABI361_02090 [Nitrososphaera sp.]|jgi:hypothetical protein
MIVPEYIRKMYKEANLSYEDYQGSVETENYERFQRLAKHEQQPIKEEISSVYRVRDDDNNEFLYYHAILKSKTRYNKKIECTTSEVGIEKVPNISMMPHRVDSDPSNDRLVPELDGFTTKYTIPYTKENIARLKKNLIKRPNFYIVDDAQQRKYPITLAELESAKFDALIEMHRALELRAATVAAQTRDVLVPQQQAVFHDIPRS